MTAPHKPHDLWRQGYRAYSARIHLKDDQPDAKSSFELEQLDLAPDFPVLKAFLRTWVQSGRADIRHVEVTECDEIDPDVLAAQSISTLVH